MKTVNYFLLITVLLCCNGCKSEPEYSVVVRNRTVNSLEALKIYWGDNYIVQLGNIYPNSGKEEGIIKPPNGKTVLTYLLNDKEIKKEIDIIGKIPKNESGRIILYIRENDVVDVEFKKGK